MAEEFTLTARWVFPVTSPPLPCGRVTVRDDRITTVEPAGARKADIDFGDAAIVPGFVNTHTHLDLCGAKGLTPPTSDFPEWLRSVIACRRQLLPYAHDTSDGIAECTRFGTTLVGDIAAAGSTFDLLAKAPLRSVVFHELLGLSREKARESLRNAQFWAADPEEMPHTRRGLSPHAPYSFNRDELAAATASWPTAIHLAESTAELELLDHHSGPFVPFLAGLGAWDASGLAWSPEQVVALTKSGSAPVIYVHCNYLSPDAPIPRHGSVVYCPRTHAAFGHSPHPFRDFLARGIRVALGTDSLASNPDLSILAEARFLHRCYPDFPLDQLLRMATLSGAEALGWADDIGSLEPAKSADFAIVKLHGGGALDPHELIFNLDLPVIVTWFRGKKVWG
jgi:cytosine/adenosine deaminase-related metal-dependent hydrolase